MAGGLPQQADAGAVLGQLAWIADVVAGDGIEAVAVFSVPGDAQRQGVADWDVDRTLDVDVVVGAILALQVAVVAGAQAGAGFSDEDRAAGGVLAGEGALRAAQNLHVGDVVVGLGLEVAREGRDAVAIGHDAGLDGAVAIGTTNAADVEQVALPEVGYRQVGRNELELVDIDHALLGQVRAGEHGSRHGRLLQVDRTPLGRDHEFLHLGRRGGAARSGLSVGGAGDRKGRKRNSRQE